MVVEAAAASTIGAGCCQELEARGSFASQRVLCTARFLQYQSKILSWAVEGHRVDSALVVGLF